MKLFTGLGCCRASRVTMALSLSCCNSRDVKSSRKRISLILFLETPIFKNSRKCYDIIKRHMHKLTQEAQKNWLKVLPITLMRAQSAP